MIRIWYLLVYLLMLPATAAVAVFSGLKNIVDAQSFLIAARLGADIAGSPIEAWRQSNFGYLYIAAAGIAFIAIVQLAAAFGNKQESERKIVLVWTTAVLLLLWAAMYWMYAELIASYHVGIIQRSMLLEH